MAVSTFVSCSRQKTRTASGSVETRLNQSCADAEAEDEDKATADVPEVPSGDFGVMVSVGLVAAFATNHPPVWTKPAIDTVVT